MKNDFPVVGILTSTPLQDYYSDGCGNRWNVARLIDATKDEPIFLIPLAGLDLSYYTWKNCDFMMLAYHVKATNDADLSKPIIIAWDGSIADGRHRIIKSLMLGKKTIKAVRMTWRPTPCHEDPK